MDIVVPMKKLHEDAVFPVYETDFASGMDLVALVTDEERTAGDNAVVIHPMSRKLVKTGIAMAIPVGFEGQVRPRSGNAYKKGLTVLNTPGTIDADFTGDVGVILYNTSSEAIVISSGDKIAQIVFAPVARAYTPVVLKLPETNRGYGGFGHTSIVGDDA